MSEIMEEWREIPEMGVRFQVSKLGRIRSIPRLVTQKTGRVLKIQSRIMSQWISSTGYLAFGGRRDDGTINTSMLVHRAMALAFIPNPCNKPEVNHKDGNRMNNLLSNLEWMTTKENIIHSFEVLNSHPKKFGEDNHRSVLDESTVESILRFGNAYKACDIANVIGISDTTVKMILSGRTWNHVMLRTGVMPIADNPERRSRRRSLDSIAQARSELRSLLFPVAT